MTSNDTDHGICHGRTCSFGICEDTILCEPGAALCMCAELLEAEESNFHDSALIKATADVNAILANVPADAGGRKLSFLHTNMGIVLAWSEHPENAPTDAVRPSDGDEAVAKALGLKNVS